MGWLEILAVSHPFILGLTLLSIFALILGMIETIINRNDAAVLILVILAILWFFAGIGYVIVG